MNTYIKTGTLLFAACMLALSSQLFAQEVYKIAETTGNYMKLSGTSTLHKWDMTAQAFLSEAQFSMKSGTNSLGIGSCGALSFTLAVKNLKSGEKGLDDNAYKALKADSYKNIYYKLTSAQVVTGSGQKNMIRAMGKLTIAGVTKNVPMDVYYVVNADGTINCKGTVNLKMTDYQVEPPTFMFGAMKTGDDLVLDFSLNYKK